MDSLYWVRFGSWPQVGRFASDLPDLGRGRTVVVRSHRGTELGEVLIKIAPSPEDPSPSDPPEAAPILRVADRDDLARARQLESDRPRRFDDCQRVIRDRYREELELVDVESLLDDRRTVLHYLGPHKLDVCELFATFRSACEIDAVFEPVGRDVPDHPEADADGHGRGCGDCGSGGGCSSAPGSTRGGCSDCGVKKLIASRRPLVAR